MGAGRDLGPHEGDAHLDQPVEQVPQPVRPVVDVEEDVRVPAQDGREGEGALDPAHHRKVVPDPLAQEADRVEAVAHPPAVLGRHEAQARRVLRLAHQDRPADRKAVLGPLDVEAEIGGLAVRVGDRLHDVERERVADREVGLHERAVVEVVVAQAETRVVGRALHVDVEVGPAVHGKALEPPAHALERLHGAQHTPVGGSVIFARTPRPSRRGRSAA